MDKQKIQAYIDNVYKILKDQDVQFIKLGGSLDDCNRPEIYGSITNLKTGKPCKNLCVFAKQEFNLSKSSVYSLIKVCRRFGFNKMTLDPKWKDYNYSQLSEMVSFTDEQLAKCRPDMTVRELRFLKKATGIFQTSGKRVSQEKADTKKTPRWLDFKNDTARSQFIQDYKKWPVFTKNDVMQLVWYKTELSNNITVIVTELRGKKVSLDMFGPNLVWMYREASNWSYHGISDYEFVQYVRKNAIKYKSLED